jgi:hypothetical protein
MGDRLKPTRVFRLWAGFAVTGFPSVDKGTDFAPPGEGIPSHAPACGSYFPKATLASERGARH